MIAKAILLASVVALGTGLWAQTPERLAFEVVSIRQNVSGIVSGGPPIERPDGGITMMNVPVVALLNRAFAPMTPAQMVGLPDWVNREHYDIRATSGLSSATPEQRKQMLQALLADRFKFVAHTETTEQAVYELTLARPDGRLGSGLSKLGIDCDRIRAERANNPPAASTPADFGAPPPSCTMRIVDAPLRDRYGDKQGRLGALAEGEGTLDGLASLLRAGVDHPVVNRTGLTASYTVRMNFAFRAGGRGLETTPASADEPPSIFTAVQEQLGLKLQPARTQREALIIDHIERPTED